MSWKIISLILSGRSRSEPGVSGRSDFWKVADYTREVGKYEVRRSNGNEQRSQPKVKDYLTGPDKPQRGDTTRGHEVRGARGVGKNKDRNKDRSPKWERRVDDGRSGPVIGTPWR